MNRRGSSPGLYTPVSQTWLRREKSFLKLVAELSLAASEEDFLGVRGD